MGASAAFAALYLAFWFIMEPIHIHNKLYIVLNDGCLENAHTISIYAEYDFFSVSGIANLPSDHLSNVRQDDDCEIALFCLSDIYRFDDTMRREIARSTAGLKQLVDIGTDPVIQARNSFFLGCHLIMSHGLGFEEAFLSLRSLHELFDQCYRKNNISVEKSLRAFCCAKCLNWIDFRISTGNDIQIDRLVHDARWC